MTNVSATTGAGAPLTSRATASASAAWPLGKVFTCTLLAASSRWLTSRQRDRQGGAVSKARGGRVWTQAIAAKQTKSVNSTTVQNRSAVICVRSAIARAIGTIG